MKEILIGNYKILEEIGRGGMGVVYLGEQISLKRQVAIKTLPLEMAHDGEFLQRIENEAKILAKFSNPNIVYIHDRVKKEDAIYLVMEYVPGITVADHLREDGPYELNEAARIIIRVAVALEHAHSKGIIHRDIKPSNIMIRQDNVVKVTDFGIAKSSEGSDITRMRFTPGTRDYMSPEQARGLRDIDGRSDIYSLGVVFYLMLTGKLPPYPVPDRLPFVPPRYEKIILQCLAEDRAARYQTAKDLVNAMDQAKEETKRRIKGKHADGRQRKNRAPLLLGALGVVLLVASAIWQMDNIRHYFNSEPEKIAVDEIQDTEIKSKEPSADVIDHQETESSPVTPPSDDALTDVTTSETLEAGVADDAGLADPTHATIPLPLPLLRSAADRTHEILVEIGNHDSLSHQISPRTFFALKTGILDAAGDDPDLAFTVKALLDQMDVVKRIDQGGCDLLINIDSISKNVVLSSNLFGDNQVDKYKESFYFEDDRQLFAMLETFIRRYYCFNILGSMNLLRPINDGFAADVTLNGGSDGMIKVGGSIEICLNSSRDAYSMLLSVNSEGIYMLFPLIREEHVPLVFQKPYCTEPMEVSPPTGSEMIVAILYLDKALLPVDSYLAAEDQVIIEPASWSYAPHSSNSAVDYCESLFISLYAAPSDQYSVISRFVKTYN